MKERADTEDDLTGREREVFPERLRELRERRGVRRYVMAALSGLRDKSVMEYEEGLRLPGFESLIKLAKYLEVSVDYLIGSSDEE